VLTAERPGLFDIVSLFPLASLPAAVAPPPPASCAASALASGVVFFVVEGVYIQQGRTRTSEHRPRGKGGGGGVPPPPNNRFHPNRLRRTCRRSRRSYARNLGRTGRRGRGTQEEGGSGVVAVAELPVTDEGEPGEGRARLMQAKFLWTVCIRRIGRRDLG
jgi:hypothetical protein